MVSDATKHRWERFKTFISFGSLIVAGAALYQSQTTAHKQSELSERALQIQQQMYERTKAIVELREIQIFLAATPNVKDELFPTQTPALPSTFEPVPKGDWVTHPKRYLDFVIANPGNSTIHVESVGIGLSEQRWNPANPAGIWCIHKDSHEWANDCSGEITAATEMRYSFQLVDDILHDFDYAFYSKGLEVCVKIQAYDTYCQTTHETALPDAR